MGDDIKAAFNNQFKTNTFEFQTNDFDLDTLSKLSLFTKAQREGLQNPTLKLKATSIKAQNDQELRRRRNVLIAYSQEEKAIIDQYLEDIRAGKYGQAELDDYNKYGDYEVKTKFNEKRGADTECSC